WRMEGKTFRFTLRKDNTARQLLFIRQHDWREDPLDKHFCNMQMRLPLSSPTQLLCVHRTNLSLVAVDKSNGKVAGVQLNSMKPKSAVLLMAVINKPFPVYRPEKR
ncbi:hypothetical protein Ocin01_19729, partial [Orchesella cincta]